MNTTWILVDGDRQIGAARKALGDLADSAAVLAVGPRDLAEAAARTGAQTRWADPGDLPVEALASSAAELVAQEGPRIVVAAPTSGGRALLGAIAARLGAGTVDGVLAVRSLSDGSTEIERSGLSGRVVATLRSAAPLCLFVDPSDAPAPAAGRPGSLDTADLAGNGIVRVSVEDAAGAGTGVADASRIVSVGRGIRQRDDLALVRDLASALGAEVGCSMPVADDLGWLPKEDYIGRSGQHVSPRLYVAVGISGAPQHLEGIRDAKTVVAINSDPEAPIFSRADYGIVGDLYEILPRLGEQLATR
jgi:electron transfer flavoprotein alpha subunit